MSDSMILTIGTALYRAWDSQCEIDLLVSDAGWLSGTVVGVDGHGVVFQEPGQTHLVLRLAAVLAVRIDSNAAKAPQPNEHWLELAAS